MGLRKHGFTVLTAIDGEDGLRQARAERPDLVLLDLVMPKLQGFEVLRMLKAEPETAAIPVIVLSSLGGDADVQAAIRAGAASYIVKTAVAMPELLAKVEAALTASPRP